VIISAVVETTVQPGHALSTLSWPTYYNNHVLLVSYNICHQPCSEFILQRMELFCAAYLCPQQLTECCFFMGYFQQQCQNI